MNGELTVRKVTQIFVELRTTASVTEAKPADSSGCSVTTSRTRSASWEGSDDNCRTPQRRRDPRWRIGRLCLRHPRRPTRVVGHADRGGQGRRNVPAPRMHPDQGTAAFRRGGRFGTHQWSNSVSGHLLPASTSRRCTTTRTGQSSGCTAVCKVCWRNTRSPSSTDTGRMSVGEASTSTEPATPEHHSFWPPARIRGNSPASNSADGSSPATRHSNSTGCPPAQRYSVAVSSASSSQASGARSAPK